MSLAPLVCVESVFIANSPTWIFLIVGHYSDPGRESLESNMNIVFSNNFHVSRSPTRCWPSICQDLNK